MEANKHKEPFVRIVKRDRIPLWIALLIRLAAILLSLVVCALLIYLITHSNPIQVYRSMVDGAVGTGRRTCLSGLRKITEKPN